MPIGLDQVSIDSTVNNIENTLSTVSAIPVVGTLAGGAKVLLGLVQTISAAVSAIFLIAPSFCIGWDYMKYCWTHIKHGVGNMIAGSFEAVPLLGTGIYFYRRIKGSSASDVQVYISSGHAFKFMSYPSLEVRDWAFTGADDDAVRRVKENYNRKVIANGGEAHLSYVRLRELAEEALAE